MAVEFEDHPFWDFSLAVYGAQGVSQACIALQERRKVDVNLLLFCTWIGASGRGTLTDEEIGAAVGAVGTWNDEVVCGLRAVRRWMKDAATGVERAQADALRRRIVKLEVDCEHAEQLALARTVSRPAGEPLPADRRADDAVANLGLYLRRRGAAVEAADLGDLTTILAAAFPESGPSVLTGKLGRLSGAGRT